MGLNRNLYFRVLHFQCDVDWESEDECSAGTGRGSGIRGRGIRVVGEGREGRRGGKGSEGGRG